MKRMWVGLVIGFLALLVAAPLASAQELLVDAGWLNARLGLSLIHI